jgi:hypothetical protein
MFLSKIKIFLKIAFFSVNTYSHTATRIPLLHSTTQSETTAVIAAVVSSQLAEVCVNQLTAREGSDLM